MSHRGICLYCGEVVWMGQPACPDADGWVHKSCLEFLWWICSQSRESPWDEEWDELLEGVKDES